MIYYLCLPLVGAYSDLKLFTGVFKLKMYIVLRVAAGF